MSATVRITLGSGSDLSIENDRLYLTDYTGYKMDLGRATQKRFDQLETYFMRLKIHAVEPGEGK